jgi:2-polyprenyl-3-methyl-5-hydroxy-6-metoxy-1,4-benzoquinol methylase
MRVPMPELTVETVHSNPLTRTPATAVPLPRNEVLGATPEAVRSPLVSGTRAQQARWSSEAAFFDRMAEQRLRALEPFDEALLGRYRPDALRPYFNKEYRFLLMGDLRGKRVLDVGCGEGSNAVLLAKRGAHVLGVDISERSVTLCRRRAEVNGVASACEFVVSPLEAVELAEASFDVVWGDGILHHVIPELDSLLPRWVKAARPGGLFVFSEPVSFHPVLRWMRRHVPVHTDATPDERPLTPDELEQIRHHLPDLRVRAFGALGRLNRFLTVDGSYERTRGIRRALLDGLQILDYGLLSLPRLSTLGSMCVLAGTAPLSRGEGRTSAFTGGG